MAKYIVHPGYIRSKNDGDRHYISYPRLCELYNVNPRDCFNAGDRDRFIGYQIDDSHIHLYPQVDSKKYVIPVKTN